jgi:hypothetical protein
MTLPDANGRQWRLMTGAKHGTLYHIVHGTASLQTGCCAALCNNACDSHKCKLGTGTPIHRSDLPIDFVLAFRPCVSSATSFGRSVGVGRGRDLQPDSWGRSFICEASRLKQAALPDLRFSPTQEYISVCRADGLAVTVSGNLSREILKELVAADFVKQDDPENDRTVTIFRLTDGGRAGAAPKQKRR